MVARKRSDVLPFLTSAIYTMTWLLKQQRNPFGEETRAVDSKAERQRKVLPLSREMT